MDVLSAELQVTVRGEKVVPFFIFFQSFQTTKIKEVRPKITKIFSIVLPSEILLKKEVLNEIDLYQGNVPENLVSCFLLQQVCRGIVAWKYYAWRNWSSEVDVGLLRAVQYDKQRQDTILRVSFYSTFGQYHKRSCGQWVIKFNHSNCIEPAPIVSLIYTAERPDHMWHIAPAEIGGFCKSTSSGTIGPGKVAITVLVQQCGQNVENNAHTGRPTGVGEATSSLLVEEYCPNESPWLSF